MAPEPREFLAGYLAAHPDFAATVDDELHELLLEELQLRWLAAQQLAVELCHRRDLQARHLRQTAAPSELAGAPGLMMGGVVGCFLSFWVGFWVLYPRYRGVLGKFIYSSKLYFGTR